MEHIDLTAVEKTIGAQPGSLIHVGKPRSKSVSISVLDYDEQSCKKQDNIAPDQLEQYKNNDSVSWINVDGIHNPDVIHQVGETFNIHPLIREDIMNTHQRPKVEETGNQIFVVLKMIYKHPSEEDVVGEQISLLVGPGYVISLQETPGDVFDPVRTRIEQGKGQMRSRRADYLMYALMDTTVDQYFIILETFSEEITVIEEELFDDPDRELLQSIHSLKRDLIYFRKSVWPLREVIGRLQRNEYELLSENMTPYLRDLYDHTIQVIDTIESVRETLSSQTDLYLSSVSNRMNEVMKTLTIIATIFIPLTFIAGVYGMNFEVMPELQWTYGYPAVLFVMAGVSFVMLLYFWRKDWI